MFLNETAYRSAVQDLLRVMHANQWFVNVHWAVNEPHVRLMVEDVAARFEPVESHHVLDVGCFNGYISYLFRHLGYRVTAADIADFKGRGELFEDNGIGYVEANFNSLTPFPDVPNESFDAVILAQVIEHILNHPQGFVSELARITRPGGLLLVTTPQPASLMNVVRLLRGHWSMWGTGDFMRLPKFADGIVISHPEIHYREYLAQELTSLVESSGYEVLAAQYLGLGSAKNQPAWKRLLKENGVTSWLMQQRLFASNQYVLARKRAS